jgi:predicted GH43/DUF377 family glycosyl hydrolase
LDVTVGNFRGATEALSPEVTRASCCSNEAYLEVEYTGAIAPEDSAQVCLVPKQQNRHLYHVP